jgi:site-specific DNA-methyltransferase (adenine-specific)
MCTHRINQRGAQVRSPAMEPAYQADGQTIYHGDCLEVMAELPSASVDIVVTSPPYNMGLVPGGNGKGMYRPGASNKAGRFRNGYDGSHDDAMEQDEYDDWQRACLGEMWRICRLGVFYNHRSRVEHGRLRFPLSWDFGDEPVLRQAIVWDRLTGIDVNLRQYCTAHELILLFAKPEFRLVDHSASGLSDVWRLGMEHGSEHPAPFPLSLPTRCIQSTGAQSVLDPFLGSGTTLRAALDAGIAGVGIELSSTYLALAVDRLAQGSLFASQDVPLPGMPDPALG